MSAVLSLFETHLRLPFSLFWVLANVYRLSFVESPFISFIGLLSGKIHMASLPSRSILRRCISFRVPLSSSLDTDVAWNLMFCCVDVFSFQTTMILLSIQWILQPSERSFRVDLMRIWNSLRSVKNVNGKTESCFFGDHA